MRLARAALFAIGGGTALAHGACSSHGAGPPPSPEPLPEDGGLAVTFYGSPFLPDGSPGLGPVSACETAGGQCGPDTCVFSIPESCGAEGGTCCVACEADPDVHRILASDYDQTCTVDSDCIAVGVGDPCKPCEVLCPGKAAINRSSYLHYLADLATSPAGVDGAACSCMQTTVSLCCNAGTCDPACAVEGGASNAGSGTD